MVCYRRPRLTNRPVIFETVQLFQSAKRACANWEDDCNDDLGEHFPSPSPLSLQHCSVLFKDSSESQPRNRQVGR